MSRRLVLDDAQLAAVRRDPRYAAALDSGKPEADWRLRGTCMRMDPDLFFPPPGGDPGPALAACRGCPVRTTCLAHALDRGDVDGVWGGTTHDERRRMRLAWVQDVAAA